MRRPFRSSIVLVLCLWFLSPAKGAEVHEQSVALDATHFPYGTVSLATGWRVRMGDDPAFAMPAFDDSGWQITSLAEDSQHIAAGIRWYRLRVKLPATDQKFDLLIFGPEGRYEIYANGTRIPGKGITSLWNVYRDHESVVPLGNVGPEVQLAIRVQYDPLLVGLGFSLSNVLLGSPEAIETARSLYQQKRVALYYSSAAIYLGMELVGLGALILFFLRRSSREFLWLGLYLSLNAINWAGFLGVVEGVLSPPWNVIADPLTYLILICQIEFAYAFAEKRVAPAWRVFEWMLLPFVLVSMVVMSGVGPAHLYLLVEALLYLPVPVILPVILFRWFLRGNREAGWLIVALLLPSLGGALLNLGLVGSSFGWNGLTFLAHPIYLGPVGFNIGDLTNLFFLLSIGVFMLVRFIRVSREQARGAAELKAARQVQQRLVPASLPAIPGFRVETAYLPANEVGGDFYQIIMQADKSCLIVVGDVSGKGLKAAMTGTLAIGALGTLIAENLSPADLLTRLNRQVMTAQDGGFITCLCLHVTADGHATIANAGHLSPYRNGEEIPLQAGLPLGLTCEVEYEESTFELKSDEQLTLLTDGVLEARNHITHELFGFERTTTISSRSAEAIARAAQLFGQEDDITVLTLTFAPTERDTVASLQQLQTVDGSQ